MAKTIFDDKMTIELDHNGVVEVKFKGKPVDDYLIVSYSYHDHGGIDIKLDKVKK